MAHDHFLRPTVKEPKQGLMVIFEFSKRAPTNKVHIDFEMVIVFAIPALIKSYMCIQ